MHSQRGYRLVVNHHSRPGALEKVIIRESAASLHEKPPLLLALYFTAFACYPPTQCNSRLRLSNDAKGTVASVKYSQSRHTQPSSGFKLIICAIIFRNLDLESLTPRFRFLIIDPINLTICFSDSF